MTAPLKKLPLKALPDDHFLSQLYSSPTFKWLKIEMEGNQDEYDVTDEYDDYEDEEGDNSGHSDFERELLGRAGYTRSDFRYILTYNDGSVNTETTFTVPLTPDGVSMARNMLDQFGRMLDNTDGAGMHITLMGDHHYMLREPLLSDAGIQNLEKNITPILPWIQLLGQATPFHRGARYCSNVVGHDKMGYPAVNIQNRKRIEFRFFHPCYDNVDMLTHYLEVISRMLEYYEDPHKTVRLHGGTGVYRLLQGTDEFNAYMRMNGSKGVKSLAFADVFAQFTGKHADLWKRATQFEPVTLAQHWSNPQYRESLKNHKDAERIAKERLNKDTAKWLTQDKSGLYDTLNLKVMKELGAL